MENKVSKDILPLKDRMTKGWIEMAERQDPEDTIVLYHKALESSEERVKQLEEENARLKGLLRASFEAGRQTLTDEPNKLLFHSFDEWYINRKIQYKIDF